MGVHYVGEGFRPTKIEPWENPFLGLNEAQQGAVKRLMAQAWGQGFERGFEEGYCAKDGVTFDSEVENPYT